MEAVGGRLQCEGHARTVLARRFLAIGSLLVPPAHKGKILAFPERAIHSWR